MIELQIILESSETSKINRSRPVEKNDASLWCWDCGALYVKCLHSGLWEVRTIGAALDGACVRTGECFWNYVHQSSHFTLSNQEKPGGSLHFAWIFPEFNYPVN